MRRGIGIAARVVIADRWNGHDLRKRVGDGAWHRCPKRYDRESMSSWSLESLVRPRHGLWKGVST
jgi:hypothetical protein